MCWRKRRTWNSIKRYSTTEYKTSIPAHPAYHHLQRNLRTARQNRQNLCATAPITPCKLTVNISQHTYSHYVTMSPSASEYSSRSSIPPLDFYSLLQCHGLFKVIPLYLLPNNIPAILITGVVRKNQTYLLQTVMLSVSKYMQTYAVLRVFTSTGETNNKINTRSLET